MKRLVVASAILASCTVRADFMGSLLKYAGDAFSILSTIIYSYIHGSNDDVMKQMKDYFLPNSNSDAFMSI